MVTMYEKRKDDNDILNVPIITGITVFFIIQTIQINFFQS